MKFVGLVMDDELLAMLDAYTDYVQMPRSEVIRRAVRWYLTRVVPRGDLCESLRRAIEEAEREASSSPSTQAQALKRLQALRNAEEAACRRPDAR